jgi:anti-sigma regulatory factor (Ser/Thr protein kinase)
MLPMRTACQDDALAAPFGLGQMTATPSAPGTTGQDAAARDQEIAVAALSRALDAALRLGSTCVSGCEGVCTLGCERRDRSRVFQARADQVRKVREFVRAALAGHAAADDAVLVASELAANSVAHSRSGRDGGIFVVHPAEVSATHVAILLIESRGPTAPATQDPGLSAESGRGLAVVRSLTSLFRVADVGDVRSLLAVIPAAAPREVQR